MNIPASHLEVRAGTRVTVSTAGYERAGKLIGLTNQGGRPMVRVVGNDGLEYRIPAAAATVTVDA